MDEYKKQLKIQWVFSKDGLQKFFDDIDKKIMTSLKRSGAQIADTISNAITDAFKDAISEMKEMLEFSQLSNKRTRDLAFGYGFSSAEAYGWTQALEMVGLESEEDLFYANQQELAQFREAFEKYSNKYSELYDAGFFEQMQEYQYEMADFKQELTVEVVDFFMNNKELIKTGMKGMMIAAEVLLKIFGWLVSAFGTTNDALTTSEVISQYSEVKNTSTNVSVNNNFNGIDKSDEAWLSNMGSLTYAQVIEALGGKQ